MKQNSTKSPLISVIIPAYNVAACIEQTLDSVLQQTWKNLEILVVDDGSTDNTGDILDRYASAYASKCRIFHTKNQGVTCARLTGVSHAAGDWIGFIDGDDEIEPEMYERLLENAVKYDADISHCGYQMVFSDGRVNHFHNSGIIREQDSDTAVRDLLEGTLVEPGLWNKLYRRELFAGLAGRMDTTIRINEDLLMNYYLFKDADKAVFDDWCPYHYIVRGGSASRGKLNEHKIYDPIRVKEIILADASEELRPDAERALVNTCVYCYCGLVSSEEALAQTARREVRRKLMEHREAVGQLPRRTRLLAELILRTPGLFRVVYPVYVRRFQKSKYD